MCICISYSMLRRITEIGAIIISLIGVFAIIFGSVLLAKNNSLYQNSTNFPSISYGIMLGLGFVLLIVGLMGIIAWWKRNNCLLGLYILGATLVVIFSIVVLIFSSGILNEVVESKDDKKCENKDFLKYSRLVYEKGQGTLCNIDCPCKTKQTYLTTEQQALLKWSETTGTTKAQDCSTFKSKIDFNIPSSLGNLSDLTELLGQIESFFDCSGFCNKNSIYVFSNSYNNKPKERDCKVEVLDFLETSLTSLVQGSLAIMIISIFSCVFACSLCCHKEKREGTPYYDDYERSYKGNNYK